MSAGCAGLTKTIATLSRQGSFWKALEVYEALPAAGLAPDTPIANAALSASNRGAWCLAAAPAACDTPSATCCSFWLRGKRAQHHDRFMRRLESFSYRPIGFPVQTGLLALALAIRARGTPRTS